VVGRKSSGSRVAAWEVDGRLSALSFCIGNGQYLLVEDWSLSMSIQCSMNGTQVEKSALEMKSLGIMLSSCTALMLVKHFPDMKRHQQTPHQSLTMK
jgi:hypothetical protein